MYWLLNGLIGCASLAAMTTAVPTPDAQVPRWQQKIADGMSAGYDWVSDKAGWYQAPPQRAYCVTKNAYRSCEQYPTLERLERVVGQVTRRIGMVRALDLLPIPLCTFHHATVASILSFLDPSGSFSVKRSNR